MNDKYLKAFLDHLMEENIDSINNFLSDTPEIVKHHYRKNRLPFEVALLYFSKEAPVYQIIHDATVMYGIEYQDLELLKYMFQNDSSPSNTFLNNINPIEYARDNEKKEVLPFFESLARLDSSTRSLSEMASKICSSSSLKRWSSLQEQLGTIETERDKAISKVAQDTASKISSELEPKICEAKAASQLGIFSLSPEALQLQKLELQLEQANRNMELITSVSDSISKMMSSNK